MKRVITYTILLLSIILTTATAHSQSYPVQANLYVMAPYSQTYSDYYADGQQRMFVNVLLNDMSQGQLDVVLRFTISGNNLKLISKPNTTAKPITILSGKLCRIEGSELAQYLKPEQMQVEGRKADEFNKSGRLPEGYYEIKVDVVEFYRKVRISAPAFTTMWIMQPEAPVWTMPQNGVRLDATNPQFVMFGWMLTNSTSLLQNVKYTFSIYAKPDDINPDVVARTTTPLYSETLTQTMLVYGPDKPLLELGGTYVCRIKAEDADGNVTFKNDGYSETLVFRYGQTCDPPRQVTITDVTKKGATVNWVESGNYSGYDIEVRETTEGKSSDWYVWNIDKQVHSYDLKQLAVSSSYECRVAAVCGQRSNGIRSQYSDVVSFKTYDAGNKNYTCGDLVEANKHEDRVPYLYLEEGDVIEANGFLFAIESISKASEGVFSGQCSWYIDLWGVSILCDFKDISINRHQQLIAGKIEACRDKVKAKAFTRLQSAAYMPIGTQVPSTFTAEKVIKMEETVDSIRIVNGQTLIYVAGKEPQKVDATDDVFVQSPDGNYYAVEGGNVYPKPSNLDSEGNRQLSYTQQLVATFGYDDAMGSHPGVDSYTDAKAPFAAQYTQYQLHSNDAYATWMAVEKYRTSMAKVTVSGGDRNAIQLRNNGQSMVRTDATDADALYMPISADGLYEAYYTTQDNKGKDVEVVAGQLNVASYERNNINVCLVGVNGEFYQYSVNELSSYLNQVFGQAVTSINLTTASIDVDKFNGTLSAKESGALSAYNSDMKKLIRKVKKLSDYNSETYYIMLVERSDDQTLGGFMPVNSNFGFVFAKANSGKEQLNRTIAHELAHGAFRLWHTFSSENIYVAQRGSTQNLMDYNGTNSELYKYQWDYIHNPQQDIVRWMVEDEEGEAWSEGTRYKCISTELAKMIKSKYRYFYYPDGSIVDMKDHLPSGFYLSTDVDAATSYGAVATIREEDRDLFYDFSRKNNNANIGYGYRLDGNAICKYKLPSISSEKASELNPVHVRLKENQVTIIDFMGHELESFVDDVCDCHMAKFRELSPDMLISEPEDIPPTAPRLFYDKKTNEIIFVTKIYDLKWLRVTDNGEQYDLDDLVAQGATYHYFTEAELADSKYNWLRTDVINAMDEGGKVVMIGLAATIAAPYLIEYAAAYGMEAGSAILQNTFKKLGTDFLLGSTSEALSYLLAEYIDKKVLSEPAQNIELGADFASDIISAGFRNMVKPSEKIKSISVCIEGVNIDDLLNSDEDVSHRILRASIQCTASAGLDKLFDIVKNRFSHKLIEIPSQKITTAIRKLKFNNPETELELVSYLCGKNSHWLYEMKRIIRENGNEAFYMLQDLDIDYMKLSTSNFERLSRFVKTNVGNENELNIMKSLLNSGRDINRMLRYIHSKGSSAKILDEICNNELFLSKIEIGGKKISARQFLLDYNGDIAVYFKRDGNYEKYMVYAIDDMKQYVEFSIDVISNTVTKIFVGDITRKFDDLVSSYENIE